MAKKQVSLYIDDHIIDIVDSMAQEMSISRNELVKRIVSEVSKDIQLIHRILGKGFTSEDFKQRILFIDRYLN